jgi:hypothetical protein
MTLPRIRELWASLDLTNKDDVAYYKELLEAAALFLTWHEGPRQIEELTRAYLELRVDDFDRGRDLYHNLHHMVDDKSRPVRAMIYSFEVMQHIPALRDHIESRIVPWFWAAHAIVREQRRSQQETSPSPEPALSHAEGPALSQAEGSESGTGGEVQKTLENSIKQLQSNADDG